MVVENQKLLLEMSESRYTFGANLSFLPLAAVLSATYPEAGFAFQISASVSFCCSVNFLSSCSCVPAICFSAFFSWNFTGPNLQQFSVFELSRSMLVIHQKRFLIKPRFIRTSSRWWVLLWRDFGWFLIEVSIFDFSWNFTGPGLQ